MTKKEWSLFKGNPLRQSYWQGRCFLPLTPLWRFNGGYRIRSSPIVSGEKVITALWNGEVVALDAKTGAVIWRVDLHGPIFSTPCVGGGRI
ncbi:MAG: PQQ-binding-like beta-propeller repeat protein, partial [bacterium]